MNVAALILIAIISVIIIITIGGNNHFLTPNTFPRLPYLRFHLIMAIPKNEGWYCVWNFILLDFHSNEPVSPWISVPRLVLCPLALWSPWYRPCEAAFPRLPHSFLPILVDALPCLCLESRCWLLNGLYVLRWPVQVVCLGLTEVWSEWMRK